MCYSARSSSSSISFLLNHGVRVLVFVGGVDYLCNWYGNKALSNALPWYNSDKYRERSLKPWIINNREVVRTNKILGSFDIYSGLSSKTCGNKKNCLYFFFAQKETFTTFELIIFIIIILDACL
ncbi:hypothetical protein BDC45DRAFT_434053 [Circinella umbellata]|nr:hypothetical protein BDC45DRAFT_434053 [Circinella umbellata]